MKKFFAVTMLSLAGVASAAAPDYRTIEMSIDINKPAAEVWSKVGGYCDIAAWLKVDCKITAGEGGVGTVRSLAGGRVTEVLVGKTALSYGYAFPIKGNAYNDFYHGFMEARPLTATTSRILYALLYDASNLPDEAARTADVERRRKMFEGALQNMKQLAEGK
jgi:hypothetical protein